MSFANGGLRSPMAPIGKARAMLMNLGSRYPKATFLVDQGSSRVEFSVPITAAQARELSSKLYHEVDLEIVAHWITGTVSDCEKCTDVAFLPSHDGSAKCRTKKSIASGGTESHCTCNACF